MVVGVLRREGGARRGRRVRRVFVVVAVSRSRLAPLLQGLRARRVAPTHARRQRATPSFRRKPESILSLPLPLLVLTPEPDAVVPQPRRACAWMRTRAMGQDAPYGAAPRRCEP
ncbi:hypothetical protein GLE_4955 [Lysobacter enzymogenes]|uniref:Uncharacterized protein n=1 Tax=Lysobacter enzymogenes TaxID=69 RepID=A0A0S2DQ17_LYSEN|nr:hypothetical protein GLE_4955 [Lysobacter enzymogenes]